MKKLFVVLVIAAGLCPLLFAPEAGAANTIKIGIVDSYSGGAAAFGLDLLDGFKMAVAEINGQGGVLGKKIEYVTRDEKFQPAVALSMAKELVMKENVDLLMGTINSATALAISDFAKTEKIPFLCTYAKSDKITGELRPQVRVQHGRKHGHGRKGRRRRSCKKPYLRVLDSGR